MKESVTREGLKGKELQLRNLLVAAKMNVMGANAIKAGADLANRIGADLSVISVIEPTGLPGRFNDEEGPGSERVGSQQDRIRRFVDAELKNVGHVAKLVQVSSGDPADLISTFARKTASEVVVVGTHRSSGFESLLPGSSGEEIIGKVGVPVLAATQDGSGPFSRILIAVDLSGHSQHILDWASRLAWTDDSEVRIIHSQGLLRRLSVAVTSRGGRTFRGPAWRRFMRVFWESDFPGHPQVILREGHPGRAVLREARTWDADLVVIGTGRFSLPFATRLGQTTRYLLRHGGRSILAIPEGGRPPHGPFFSR